MDVYVQSRAKIDVLEIAKKWEIYIDPEYKADVEKVEKEKEKAAAPGVVIGKEEFERLWDQIAQLTNQMEEDRKKREELEKILKGT